MTLNGIKANVQYDFCLLLSLASCNCKHSSDFVAASEKVSESPHENEISIRGYVFYKFCIKDLNRGMFWKSEAFQVKLRD